MAFFIQFPDDPSAHGTAGAKASVLARLAGEGLPVPPWFVITAEAFWGNLTIEQREAMAEAKTPMTLAASLADLSLSASFLKEVNRALQRLCPRDEPFVVRASVAAADVESFELASPVQPKIHTLRHEIGDRIAEIYRAAYSEPVLVQRRRHRLDLCPEPPALLVQRMVSPDASGAAFGADLTTGQRSITVVAAVFGLPSSMSSGACAPDLYRVDRNGRVVQRDIATKNVAHRPSAVDAGGFVVREIPSSGRQTPVLGTKEITRIWTTLAAVERSFECPQEMHWALEGDRLYILDAAPLTQLDRHADPDSPRLFLDSGALADILPGVVLPLTASVAQRAAPQIARAFLESAGVSDEIIARQEPALRNLFGIVRSRVYANLESWYLLFTTLPDYPYNARYYGHQNGWTSTIPPDVERALRRGVLITSPSFRTALAMRFGFSRISGRVARFHREVADALKALPPLERARLDELAECYRSLENRLLPVWDAPPLNEYYTLIAYGYLTQHAQKLWPQEYIQALVGLLSRSGAKWLPPAIGKIQEIALSISHEAEIVDVLREGSLVEIYAAIAGQTGFRARCEDYIARHGAMTFGGCKLEAPSLADDPLPLFRAIAQAAIGLHSRKVPDAIVFNMPSREDVLAAPHIGYFDRKKLRWLTDHMRARLRDRELITADVGLVIAALRQIFIEIGRRFYALGLLASPRDIFYLTVEEVLGYVEATRADDDIVATVRTRQAYYADLENRPAPSSSFAAHLPMAVGNPIDAKADLSLTERRGIGASPGFVRGSVLMAGSPRRPSSRGPYILCAEYADASWPLLYPGVDGIIIEKGGALSAAVIGYRDQRIPAIVGVPNLTAWLSDGDLIDMDGAIGMIRKVQGIEQTAEGDIKEDESDPRDAETSSQPPANGRSAQEANTEPLVPSRQSPEPATHGSASSH